MENISLPSRVVDAFRFRILAGSHAVTITRSSLSLFLRW